MKINLLLIDIRSEDIYKNIKGIFRMVKNLISLINKEIFLNRVILFRDPCSLEVILDRFIV